MAKRTLTPLPKTVKETVDFVYEYLIEHPDGVSISMTKLLDSRTQKKIVCILIKRGIIQKKPVAVSGRSGCAYKYKWVATMPPTKTLYGSIVMEIHDAQNNWPSWKKKKAMEKQNPIVDENQNATVDIATQEPITNEPTTVFTGFAPLDGFSDQELWDELKRRGYSIEDNRLVIIKKTYLN